jgi:hypothetical protein
MDDLNTLLKVKNILNAMHQRSNFLRTDWKYSIFALNTFPMNQSTLISTVINAIDNLKKGNIGRSELFSNSMAEARHDFLFFVKPEITLQDGSINLLSIMEMIFGKLDEFNLKIRKIILLPATYLEKYDIIARHYGIINTLAKNAKTNLPESAAAIFHSKFGVDLGKSNVYGSLEFLSSFPEFTPLALDYLWQNSPTVKLGGGAYCQELKFDGNVVFLVNGFHPRQLQHYTAEGRSIVAFTLTGDLDWGVARNRFIGKTNPAEAEIGSIRRTLLENKDRFGLSNVNSSWNGVHLSAGPVESLVELIRYNSDFDNGMMLQSEDFNFGKTLASEFSTLTIQKILDNQTISFGGKNVNIYDLTEEKNSDEAIKLLKEVFSSR